MKTTQVCDRIRFVNRCHCNVNRCSLHILDFQPLTYCCQMDCTCSTPLRWKTLVCTSYEMNVYDLWERRNDSFETHTHKMTLLKTNTSQSSKSELSFFVTPLTQTDIHERKNEGGWSMTKAESLSVYYIYTYIHVCVLSVNLTNPLT